MRRLVLAAVVLAATGLITGCDKISGINPQRNWSLDPAPNAAYVWENIPPGELPETLVIVTASGGGLRAAALALGVLRGMNAVGLESGKTLADEIDVISSVSGGSVTAGYFALTGTRGLDDLKNKFITQHNMGRMIGGALRPDQLLSLASPTRERTDVVIDYLDKTLYGGATFASLAAHQRRPYLIVNSADMVEGSPFPFTQPMLDLLCSDLAKMKISTAVGASAAFPFANTPVTLENFSRPQKTCAGMKPVPWADSGSMTSWYEEPARARWQRAANAYASGRKAYVHLLDGGIADNLGISEPYRLLTQDDVSPSFKRQIALGKIKKIIVVTINARVHAASPDLDASPDTPSLIQVANGTVGAIRGAAALGTAEGLRIVLSERLRVMAATARQSGNVREAQNFATAADNTLLIAVDFEAIPDRIVSGKMDKGRRLTCRDLFNDIATSWTVTPAQVAGLEALGSAQFLTHPSFERLLRLVKGKREPVDMTVEKACALVEGKEG
jgi:NTE family protein